MVTLADGIHIERKTENLCLVLGSTASRLSGKFNRVPGEKGICDAKPVSIYQRAPDGGAKRPFRFNRFAR